MDFVLTNPWTVGIIGGIISGLIVFFVTNRLVSRRENKEYQQKIRIANNELLYAIRPLIVQQKLPTIEMVNSLLLSTAKKYGVQTSDLYTKNDIADDLTKEVMDNSFLTSDSKLKYCALTEDIKNLSSTSFDTMRLNSIIYSGANKSVSKEFLSFTLAFIATLTSLIGALVAKGSIFSDGSSEKISKFFVVFTGVAVLIPVLALVFTKFLEVVRERNIIKYNPIGGVINSDALAKVEAAKVEAAKLARESED